MSKIQPQQQQQQQQIISTSPTKHLLKHWSQKKHESVLAKDLIEKANFLDSIQGGSDNGQFVYISKSFNIDQLQFQSGKFLSNEIILEIQNYKISGYTLYDVQLLLKQILKTYATITFVTVKSNSLPIDLRTYLDERFQKGSIDYDLQQIIRENVYMRTVPCTTRAARPGEVNGQDYIFLTNNDFLELEKHGDLLEYGVYNGHYYGTPKPPKEPRNGNNISMMMMMNNNADGGGATVMNNTMSNNLIKRTNSITDMMLAQQQQQTIKNGVSPTHVHTNGVHTNGNSPTTATTNGYRFNNSLQSTSSPATVPQQQIQQSSSSSLILQTGTSTNNNNNANDSELIPYGWQKVEDAEYGTFYIDHINKQTTYENPLLQQQQQQKQTTNNNANSSSSLKTFKPSGSNTIEQFDQQQQQMMHQNKNYQQKNIFFTRNPNDLKGDFLKTTLLKTHQGFGFTIIGANETSEDFLQIKHIVPNGAADIDNKLRQGDILVYVNSECVLGYTHQDVVEMFQSIPIGDYVELTVCRGYPISIDFNDPTIEIKSLAAINKKQFETNGETNGHHHHHHQHIYHNDQNDYSNPDMPTNMDNSNNLEIQQLQQQFQQHGLLNDDDYIDIYVSIVKGPMGFGFTIADDALIGHQKVKQILDRERCVDLLENDILCEINGIQLINMSHNQIVEILKDCPKGKETYLKLKRSKINHLINHKNNFKINESTELKAATNDAVTTVNGINGSSSATNSTSTMKKQYQQQPKIPLNSNNIAILNNANNLAERRSKTPSNLFAGSQNNIETAANLPLRSKTPTNDRYAASIPAMPPIITKQQQQVVPTPTNDNYYYLNQIQQQQQQQTTTKTSSQLPQSKSATAISSTTTPGTGPSNLNNILFNPQDLYSTVNKPQPVVVNQQHKENQQLLSNEFELRLKQQQQQQQKTNKPNTTLRSKTPGPELFRDRTNITNMSANNIYYRPQQSSEFEVHPEAQYDQVTSPTKYNTISSQQVQQRSKTPTAEMYYSAANSNHFDTIYQPFIPRKPQQFNNSQDIYGNGNVEYKTIDIFVELHRHESGFGFRIVGGDEEGSQVAVGFIVPNGAADTDGRLKPNDEIIMIDNENVVGASHKRVVKLMTIAGLNRKVKLWVKRKVPITIGENPYPYTITLFRNGNEGFGFVIISTLNRAGPSIGKIVENSPAERCGRLKVGDRILAVNNIDITQMNHVDIVKLIKDSGNSITLTIGPPIDEPLIISNNNSPNFAVNIQQQSNNNNYDVAPIPPSRNDSKGIIKSITPTSTLTSSKSRILQTNLIQQQQQQQQHHHQLISPVNVPPPQMANKPTSQGEYHLIELRKHSNTGFGFSIRGGREFNIPIFVLKLADNGPAALDGRLRVGDQILEINSFDAYNMSHNEAIERIKSGGSNTVSLLVRRTGLPPPSITDIIAATNNPVNGNVNTNGHQISPTPMYSTNTMRPSNVNNNILNQQQNGSNVFPYHQSESTLLRPKSPYITPELAYLQQQQHQQQIFLQQQQQQQRTTSHSLSALTNRNF